MKKNCPFCKIYKKDILKENKHAFSIRDKFPVTKGHTLIITKHHEGSYFNLNKNVIDSCLSLIKSHKIELSKNDINIKGFNIGINVGETAGQTVDHCHIHLIPRRSGDQKNPKGGVRGVIPSKQKYSATGLSINKYIKFKGKIKIQNEKKLQDKKSKGRNMWNFLKKYDGKDVDEFINDAKLETKNSKKGIYQDSNWWDRELEWNLERGNIILK